MKKNLVILSLFMAFSLALGACANAAPAQDAGQVASQVAAQVEAQVATRVAQAMAAIDATQKAQPTTAPIIPTMGALPTLAPVNLPTLSLPGVATNIPCNPPPANMGENYPDGSTIYINTAFNKSWTLKNMGTCTWNANYRIKFMDGDAMSGPSFKLFGASVPPGGSITLTLPLKTPGGAGTTTGYWGLYDDKGGWFGRVWVTINSITVAPTSSSFAVTKATTTVNTTAGGSCPFTFVFTANIATNGAGKVYYHWIRDDSPNAGSGTLTYSSAGTQTVTLTWDLGVSADSWVQMYIDKPNNQGFNQVHVQCP